MYARGMSTREITGHLRDLYGIDVSPDLISTVTDAVLDEVATWQQRRSTRFTRWFFSMRSG
jgi:putative transposase